MIPENVVLARGSHKPADKQGCVMEWVSVKWHMVHGMTLTEAWEHLTDSPTCTEPMVYRAAQTVNDRLDHDERQRLIPLILRLMRAHRVSDPVRAKRCRVRVACWAARSVLDQVPVERRDVAERAIATAEAWLRGEANEGDCRAAADAAYAAADAAANAAYAVLAAANAAYAAYAAANAAYAAANAVAEIDLVLWLDELLDQWEKARAEEGVLHEEAE